MTPPDVQDPRGAPSAVRSSLTKRVRRRLGARLARLSLLGVCLVGLLFGLVPPVAAQDDTEVDQPTQEEIEAAGFVDVVEISGLLDPVLASKIEDAVAAANREGARALVLQLNSRQTVISDERLNELAVDIADSTVPVVVWVGPSGSRATGKVAQLVGVADQVGVAIGSRIGGGGEQVLDPERFGTLWGDNAALIADTELNWQQAVDLGVVPCDFAERDELGNPLTPEQQLDRCANPTLGDFLISIDSFETRQIDTDEGPRLAPVTQTRLSSLSLLDQLMHTVASPPVAYLLLVIGMALVVFEFYSIGIGLAGVIGAVLAALGGYGLGVLPIRTWALVLLVLSMVAYSIDVQAAVPRAWTVIGTLLFAVGTLFLYPQGDVAMSWIPMLVGIVGMAIVFFRGMPIMVRGRFATTAIERPVTVD